jgi:dTDP-4-dehydrorhamnose reductase
LRLAKEREDLKVINDQYGVPTSAEWLTQVSLNLVLDQQFNLRKLASGIYHAVPAGETTWYSLARLTAQVAIDAGVILKVSPEAIKPISAVEYALPAPRPMNSRLDTAKLQLTLEHIGDMSKLQHSKQVWSDGVRAYVAQLAQDRLI